MGDHVPPQPAPWQAPPTAYRSPATPYDGGSVAGLLLLGTCLLGPVSVFLGIRGMQATSGGDRRGRWCAVTAVVGGLLLTVLLVLGVVGREGLREQFRTDIDATVGECVDLLYDLDDEFAGFDTRKCTEEHEAEVGYRGKVTGEHRTTFGRGTAADLCAPLLTGVHREAARTGNYLVSVATSDAEQPSVGDTFVCLLHSADGAPLSSPIGGNV